MADSQSSEELLEQIMLLLDEPRGALEDEVRRAKLLISDHWDLLEDEDEIDEARAIRESLAEDLLQEEGAPRRVNS